MIMVYVISCFLWSDFIGPITVGRLFIYYFICLLFSVYLFQKFITLWGVYCILNSQPTENLKISLNEEKGYNLAEVDPAAPFFFPACRSLSVSQVIWRTGRQKAPVFPDPVSAAIRTSPPPRIRGMASAWTSVGNLWNEWMKKWMEKINEKVSVMKVMNEKDS